MDKLLIVDGHNLLFQMFFGMPSRIVNAQGVAIHGVVGFVGALNRILAQVRPTHVVVLFDGERGGSRREIYSAYKANRTDYSSVEEDKNPFSQLPYVFAALDFCGIKHAETDGAETDDVIASYVRAYREYCRIVISSFDSDYFQLIDDNVSVFRYKGRASVLCDKNFVLQKYGICPCSFADFKAVVGDKSDNVEGLRGIGPKTAQSLIEQFGTVQNLCSDAQNIKNPRLRQIVENGKDVLVRNLQLIKLQGNQPLPFPVEELKWDSDFKTMEVVRGIGL